MQYFPLGHRPSSDAVSTGLKYHHIMTGSVSISIIIFHCTWQMHEMKKYNQKYNTRRTKQPTKTYVIN
jgi:FtsZ-interacting cell division protein ZipA